MIAINTSEKAAQRPNLTRLDAEGYEQVVFYRDSQSRLQSIIAVHSTKRGPALGGCRFYPYSDEQAALRDVLDLARAMTYKAALAELALGGGKAVIIGDPQKDKTEKLLRAYGSFVDQLGGKYITTEDSGTSPADMDIVHLSTKHVVGTSASVGGGSGDPSPMTALGVMEGIRACAKFVFGSTDLAGKRIAIQGVGHVGFPLARHLHEMGASLVVTDTKQANLEKSVREFGAEVVEPKDIFDVKCDIFSPCAMGGALNDQTLERIRCKIVAGAANNQLASPEIAKKLKARGIVYAPDFAINAGGLINVDQEIEKYDRAEAERKTRKIFDTISEILKRAEEKKTTTAEIALEMAKERLN